MDDTTAADIIKAYATSQWAARTAPGTVEVPDGTGTPPDEQGLNLARALFIAADALETRARLASRRHGPTAKNAGRPWSADEDERLLGAYDAGATIETLAVTHERTRAGIEARLARHGRLDEHTVRGGLGLRYPAKRRAPSG